MELSEFAGRILLSASLADKIADAGEFTDLTPRPRFDLPERPQRCSRLSLDRWQSSSKVSFPTRTDLLQSDQVGVLLHFFANHELLALELMALALLKFPDAPAAFRMGIAHTMRDEQRHLRAYLARMSDFGIGFGDIPLNDFFWSQCASMVSPMDYVSRMSLTFEQANLDFAAYFRDVLSELGDQQTAHLLDEVLRDEMSHVRHGLNWFRRWKPENSSDWQAFCAALGGVINPSRAKGSVFRAEYRKEVGLSDDYISALHIFSQSKGRPPRAVFFNPDAEEDVRAAGRQAPAMNRTLQTARDDLAPVMLYVSSQTDMVVVPKSLPTEFLLNLKSAGFSLPEVALADLSEQALAVLLKDRKLSGVLPWSVSPTTMRLERTLKLETEGVFVGPVDDLRWLHSKATALELLKEFLLENPPNHLLVDVQAMGQTVASSEQFDKLMAEFSKRFLNLQFVAKRPLSASGRHRIYGEISHRAWASQPEIVRHWFEKSWASGEIPLVQPFFKRVVDLSVQARIDGASSETKTLVLGMTRVLNADRGQYLGTCVGRFMSDLPSSVLRFFHGQADDSAPEALLKRLTVWTGQRLAARGFRGSFGIDAFIYQTADGELRLYPMIEINPRFTMGRVALALSKRMVPGRVGCWLHISKSMLEKLNAESFVELKERWSRIFPLKNYERSGGIVIVEGLLETTPAELCDQVWTCFLVLQNVHEDIRKLGLQTIIHTHVSSADDQTAGKPAMPL